jgi:hypothetical protein
MTMPNPAVVDRILNAARDRDAVRASKVMSDVWTADGSTVFTRQELAARWTAAFPGDAAGNPPVPSRINKGMQSLAKTVAVIRDASSYTIGDTTVLAWLGIRNALIGSTPSGVVDLPVGPDDIAAVEQMVTDRGDVV